jgi:hypothetical protein
MKMEIQHNRNCGMCKDSSKREGGEFIALSTYINKRKRSFQINNLMIHLKL